MVDLHKKSVNSIHGKASQDFVGLAAKTGTCPLPG
jgi:hypothetical protein